MSERNSKGRRGAFGRAWQRFQRRTRGMVSSLRRGRGWTISPYPAGKQFGFTIVHDADSAYSRRLAPIMGNLDALGLRITVTVFPFWAAWAPNPIEMWESWRRTDPFFSPVSVPLEDPDECRFYQDLQQRGHEIALHTPSETSSTRDDVARSFAFFSSVFGEPARTYVEHSPDNNLDAQRRFGADPASPFYNTDLLNASQCWVWVCDHETDFPLPGRGALNVRSDWAGPFSPRAREKFGIEKAFIRSRIFPSGGDGFLAACSTPALDRIQRDGGLILAYTHLASGWLDPSTRALRDDLERCLGAIAARNGWFVPVAEILDRFAALKQLRLRLGPNTVELQNEGAADLTDLTIRAPRGKGLSDRRAGPLPRLAGDLLLVGDLAAHSSIDFRIVRV